ncbi:hypothetical protein MHTCC0001_04510 [Flavobacteriaceae bacterium MHTCC 0001]
MKVYKNDHNSSIINAIENGNDAVIKAFYTKHLPRVTSHVLKNSGKEEDARDIFQDAMVLVFEKIKANTLQIDCALGTYVYGVCKYLWLNRLRRKGKTEVDDTAFGGLEAPIDNAEDLIDKAEKKYLIQKYLLQLGVGCQDILLMFFGGYSLKEIAQEKGFTEGYARKRKFICQKQLVKLTENDPVLNEFKLALHTK